MHTVRIPEALIQRLQSLGPHFIRVVKRGKEPLDKGWPVNPLFANDPKLCEWLREGGNYGVVGGFGLVIVDIDLEELKQTVREKLPSTFTVQSPGSQGWHLYYICSLEKPIRLRDKDGENIGDIQGQGKQVVGPNSKHPSGGIYKIVNDKPLAQVTREQLVEAFKDFVIPDKEIQLVEATARLEKSEFQIDLNILDVIPGIAGLHRQGSEYFGSHPVHGSETGRNFWINPSRNCWHCFRHGTGGGPLLWLAVEEGIIDCAEASSGTLRGSKFMEVLKKARERGLIKEMPKLTPNESEFWKHGVFQPVSFAEYLVNKYHMKTDRDDDTIYVYNPTTGIYTPTGESIIVEEMAVHLDEKNRNRYLIDVKHHIHGVTYFDRPKTQNEKIATFNGLINVKTGEVTPFTPKEFITIQIPITYEPSAGCPKIQKFIEEVVGQEQTKVIREFMGYCLCPGYPFAVALMLEGDGENGKSTLINLIKRFLGKQNVSSLTLQEICSDRFGPAELHNKLANLCADLPDKALRRTGQFKMLTGGDPMSSAQKYKRYLHWTNRAKMLFSTNKVPETQDDTRAFFRRFHIIECKNYFPADKRDPNILAKISSPTEMSGLLNWALQGLHRLLENGKFSETTNYKEKRRRYIRKSNSAKAYIEENLKFDINPDSYILEKELYKKYVLWCGRNGLPTKRKGELTQNIHQYLPEAKQTMTRIDEKPVHVWQYVKFVTTVTTPL